MKWHGELEHGNVYEKVRRKSRRRMSWRRWTKTVFFLECRSSILKMKNCSDRALEEVSGRVSCTTLPAFSSQEILVTSRVTAKDFFCTIIQKLRLQTTCVNFSFTFSLMHCPSPREGTSKDVSWIHKSFFNDLQLKLFQWRKLFSANSWEFQARTENPQKI